MKITPKKMLEAFKKSINEKDIHYEITGTLVEVEGRDTFFVGTDSYILFKMQWETSFTPGVYDFTNLKQIQGKYPEYQKILPEFTPENLLEVLPVEKFVSLMTNLPERKEDKNKTVRVEYQNKEYNKEYLKKAVDFISLLANFRNFQQVYIYKQKYNSKAPVCFVLDAGNFAVFMPLV